MKPMRRIASIVLALLLSALGVFLGFSVHGWMSGREQAQALREMDDILVSKAHHLEEKLGSCLENLYALRDLFRSSEYVSASEFATFSQSILLRHPEIQATEWVPQVLTNERGEHELLIQEFMESKDYETTVHDDTQEATYHYPVVYMYPTRGNEPALGFDVASEPRRRRALEDARETGAIAMTEPITLIQEESDGIGFLAFLAIGMNGTEHLEQQASAAEPELQPSQTSSGFVLLVLRFDHSVIQRLFVGWTEDVYFALEDVTDPHETVRIYKNNFGSPATEHFGAQDIMVGGRTWKLVGTATPEFFERRASLNPLLNGIGIAFLWHALMAALAVAGRWLQSAAKRRELRVLRSVLGSLVEGVVITDLRGVPLRVNPQALRFGGKLGEPLPVQQWPERIGVYHADGKTLYKPEELPLMQALTGKTTTESEVYIKNQKVPEGAWVSVNASPIQNRAGVPLGAVMVFRDVTKARRARELVERLSRALEHIGDAVFITNADGIIEYVNQGFSTLTQYRPESMLGRKPDFLQTAQLQLHARMNAVKRDAIQGMSVLCECKNRVAQVELSVMPMRNEADALTHDVWVMRDLTDALRRQEHETEMRLAAEVQARLYPRCAPPLPGFDVAGAVFSAEATCGDYFDYFSLPQGRLGLAIGDVSGHGLGPALVMSETRTLLRMSASRSRDPSWILREANQSLYEDLETHRFVTMLLVTLELETSKLLWASAGHPSAIVVNEHGEVRRHLTSTGLPLGLFPNTEYGPSQDLTLGCGETVVMITDGVLEAANKHNVPFEIDRLIEVVRRHHRLDGSQLISHIHQSVREHMGTSRQDDDITMVVLKRN